MFRPPARFKGNRTLSVAGLVVLALMLVAATMACTGSGPEAPRSGRDDSRQAARDALPTAEAEAAATAASQTSAPAPAGAPPSTGGQGSAQSGRDSTQSGSVVREGEKSFGHCDPVPYIGPEAHSIESLELYQAQPRLMQAYLSACLEGAWRLMEQLSMDGLLSRVGIAVVDSGIVEPTDAATARDLALKFEFDWDRIIVSDVVKNREPETEEEHILRSHHGAAVTSVIGALNHDADWHFPSGFQENSSFSGVVTSVPDLDYTIYFFEHTGTGKKQPSFDDIKDALDEIKEYGPAIDVVNLSLGLQCNPDENPFIYANCVYNPVNLVRHTNWYRNKIRDMPDTIFVVGAGNIGQNAADTTVPARLSLEMDNVIAVGAINPGTNNRWSTLGVETSSNFGPAITVATSGFDVHSVQTELPGIGYQRQQGTSIAAPLVTGVVALMRSIDPDIPSHEVKDILQATGTLTPVCTTNTRDDTIDQCPAEDVEQWVLMNAHAAILELLDRRGIPVPEVLADETEEDDVGQEAAERPNVPVFDAESVSPAVIREALTALYNATNGPDWKARGGWLGDGPIDEWHGVITDTTNRFIKLNLAGNGLTGELPAELGDLTPLKELDLSGNQISGTIPAELGNLAFLEELSLAGTQLSGPIPGELGSLASLRSLNLSGNQLSGQIPSSLGNLFNLRELSIRDTNLSGSIPPALGNLSSLQFLDLRSENLSGRIPSSLGNLGNLEKLYLSETQISGQIPDTFGNLVALREMNLSGNQLTGQLPSSFGNLTNLLALDLRENQLSGQLPLQLGNAVRLRNLHLKGNRFSGCLPAKLESRTHTDIFALGLPLCEDDSGDIDPLAASDREALVAVARNLNIRKRNWLTSASIGRWEGVYTDASGRVVELNIGDVTHIPSELGQLTGLKWLSLTVNGNGWRIPSWLGNLGNLRELHISVSNFSDHQPIGGIPATLGNLEELRVLSITSRLPRRIAPRLYDHVLLQGGIPAELGNLSNLRELYISGHSRLRGPIPPELGNLTNLKVLELSGNGLTGTIPPPLGNLTNLEAIDLTGNSMTGDLPSEIGRLSALERIRLDWNQLTGCLPTTFEWLPMSEFQAIGLPFCTP